MLVGAGLFVFVVSTCASLSHAFMPVYANCCLPQTAKALAPEGATSDTATKRESGPCEGFPKCSGEYLSKGCDGTGR